MTQMSDAELASCMRAWGGGGITQMVKLLESPRDAKQVGAFAARFSFPDFHLAFEQAKTDPVMRKKFAEMVIGNYNRSILAQCVD